MGFQSRNTRTTVGKTQGGTGPGSTGNEYKSYDAATDPFAFLTDERSQEGAMQVLMGTPPGILTKMIVDPLKQEVATPLSAFLASEMGQGLPRYPGQLTSSLGGPEAEEFFKTNVEDPALQTYKEDMLPLVREEFAGSLSGSGRFRTEEESASRFTQDLSKSRVSTYEMFKQARDADLERVYQDWFKSLPQNNPMLQNAIAFLKDDVSTGTDVLTAKDPGSEGMLSDIMEMIGDFMG